METRLTQTVSIIAQDGDVKGECKVVISEGRYTYMPINGGFEIVNGTAEYTRPIYAPHMNDSFDSPRYIYYVGDKPKIILTDVIDNNDGNVRNYANMFFGLKNENGLRIWIT